MGFFKEIEGDLIELTKLGRFDIIVHGCNCFCVQKAGIANQMRLNFSTDKFEKEQFQYSGDIHKLGTIDFEVINRSNGQIFTDFITLYLLWDFIFIF